MPSDFIYRRHFGSWREAVIKAGFEPKKTGGFSIQARNASALAHRGKRSFSWKGGRIIDRFGYVHVWKPEHPNSFKTSKKSYNNGNQGYVLEHRLIMSEHLGRPLLKTEQVHHKNGNRQDNRIENLELWITSHPSGKRIEDMIAWAKDILTLYENPELLNDTSQEV